MTIALIILDGWGLAPPGPGNALSLAHLPVWDQLKSAPSATLQASGEAVGLAPGQMGNSNVGHMNIGAGRIVLSDLSRISRAVRDGRFLHNPVLREALSAPRLHILTLFSDGGVHSSLSHLVATLKARKGGETFLHLFTDGRDVPPTSSLPDLDRLPPGGENLISSVTGRFYAMDRDKRWERTEAAYRAVVEGRGDRSPSAREAIRESYSSGTTDEFITPHVIGDYPGARPGDRFLFLNFRADRARQISRAIAGPAFDAFSREMGPFALSTLTVYEEAWPLPAAFLPAELKDTLGAVVSRAGLRQYRVAETEKYAHVTYFLDGGKEQVLPGEKRAMVPSPKVKTYDLEPEMSARGVTDAGIQAIREGADLLILNYANPDMVGHTGDIPAAVRAAEAVDQELGRLLEVLSETGGKALIIADHGNIEMMIDPVSGGPHTSHTTNLVPVRLLGVPGVVLKDGILADVAPTLLDLLAMAKPSVMTGNSLILKSEGDR